MNEIMYSDILKDYIRFEAIGKDRTDIRVASMEDGSLIFAIDDGTTELPYVHEMTKSECKAFFNKHYYTNDFIEALETLCKI